MALILGWSAGCLDNIPSAVCLLYIPVSFFTIKSHISCLLAQLSSGRGAMPLSALFTGSEMKDRNLKIRMFNNLEWPTRMATTHDRHHQLPFRTNNFLGSLKVMQFVTQSLLRGHKNESHHINEGWDNLVKIETSCRGVEIYTCSCKKLIFHAFQVGYLNVYLIKILSNYSKTSTVARKMLIYH